MENLTQDDFIRALEQRVSSENISKLRAASVAIAGLGGLGSHIAVMLARSGIGSLFLVDFDVVEITNLNRQVYRMCHLGQLKTDALQEILHEINPWLNIETKTVRITAENAASIFCNFQIVCEAFDRPEEKAMLTNTLLERCPQAIVITGTGLAGYGSSNEITTRRISSRLYLCGDGQTEATIGTDLMAPRVMICAGHQANMVIQLLLKKQDI